MLKRNIFDPIIISIFPHLLSLLYLQTYTYFIILLSSIISSILWHKHKECNNNLFIIDYSFAFVLTAYEIIFSNDIIISIFLNISVFSVNKITDYLSNYNIIYYEDGHILYHLISSLKTIYISKKISNF